EVVRPVAQFLTGFIKPPNDYASVIAFDMRPAVITDFTNDPNRIRGTIQLLLNNQPAFRENNLFDALKFSLLGGRSESEFLDGKPFPMTFEGEIPDYLRSINAMLRSQYSMSYDLAEKRPAGMKYKLDVKVDVDGDGVYDDKVYIVQHKPFYVTAKAVDDKKKI